MNDHQYFFGCREPVRAQAAILRQDLESVLERHRVHLRADDRLAEVHADLEAISAKLASIAKAQAYNVGG